MFTSIAQRSAAAVLATFVVLSAAACSSSAGSAGSTTAGPADGSTAVGSIGVILPDASSSSRWEASDRPSLKKAFAAAGIVADIQNAGLDTSVFSKICDSMINEKVKVILIANVDSDSGAACEKKAAKSGVFSIDYDRLTLGGGASYYVSFDNVKVGTLMGEGVKTCLTKEGISSANLVYIDGDPTDNNAALVKQGYVGALKADIDTGKYKLVGEQTGKWQATAAGTAFDRLYTANNGKIDAVVSANDSMAGGVVARLAANGLAGKVPVTGQDASVEGLQRVLAGTQCMTVYKNTALEADAAAKLASDLNKGDKASADALATGSVQDTQTKRPVKSVLATPEAIFQDGVKKVISDGFQRKSDICTGDFAAACTKYGVS